MAIIIIMLILLFILSIPAGKLSPIPWMEWDYAERKCILARMTFPMILILEFTHNVACLKNRDLLGRFEGPIWHAYLL